MQAERYDERLRNVFVISFIMKLKSGVRIDGDDLWACLSFIIIMEAHREMELCME